MNPTRHSQPRRGHPTGAYLKTFTCMALTLGAFLAWGQTTPAPVATTPATEAPPPVAAQIIPAAASRGDGRLISQPRPLDGAVSVLGRLRPKRFLQHTGHLDNRGRAVLDPDPTPSSGLIAQEAAQIVPEAVYRPEDDTREFWGLDHERLVPLLVRAIQEQQSDLQSQSSRIQNLESQVSSLVEELHKLKLFTLDIDQAARSAFGDLRSKLSSCESKASSADSKTSCTCSK